MEIAHTNKNANADGTLDVKGVYLDKEELAMVQSMNGQFTKMKMALGDLEITKHNMLKDIDALRADFYENEKNLGVKYGNDAIINVQTGEVTKKVKENGKN